MPEPDYFLWDEQMPMRQYLTNIFDHPLHADPLREVVLPGCVWVRREFLQASSTNLPKLVQELRCP